MTGNDRWWEHAVGYEVYIRSFADGDGDGVGDLTGLTAKLDHIAWLGIDILWITPFYPSPMTDWGYDVADYADIDPLFGDLDAFDTMLARAHELGLKVIIDIVPNHSSDQHRWFQEALRDPSGPYRDYYIWADPPADGGLPNNWISYFGGPAWTLDDASGQYYMHLFLDSQPDLNWRNPAVHAEFENILRFWLDRGVDGFRIDVAHALVKDEQFRSNPQLGDWDPETQLRWQQWDAFDHVHDILQPEAVEIYQGWNRVVSEYGALLLGETYDLHNLERLNRLLETGDALHVGFWFGAMHMAWDATEIREALDVPLRSISAGVGWAQNSHDEHRSVTRFGGGDQGRRRALALSVLLFGLPGLPFLYHGEELGLESGDLPDDVKLDPVGNDPDSARDVARTPIPWSPGPGMGFTTGTDTWLPFGGRTDADTVAVQRANEGSWLHRTRELIVLRKGLDEIADAPFAWLDLPPGLVGFTRGDLAFVLNTAGDVDAPVSGTVLYRSGAGSDGRLDADEAMIVRLGDG